MAVQLNEEAVAYAKQLIHEGTFVADDKDAWSEDQPSTEDENDFIDAHGYDEYGKWFLGINNEASEETKERFEFPFGDFKKVHRGGLIAAEVRAGQYKHAAIEKAAKDLREMIDSQTHKGNYA